MLASALSAGNKADRGWVSMSSSVAGDTKSPVEAAEAPEGRGGVQTVLTNSRMQLCTWGV